MVQYQKSGVKSNIGTHIVVTVECYVTKRWMILSNESVRWVYIVPFYFDMIC